MSAFNEETIEQILDYGRESNPEGILEEIYKRIGETQEPRFLAEGSYARVYWLRKNSKSILKITDDRADAMALQRLKDNPKKSLIKVFDVFNITRSKLWGIVAEKLTPMSSSEEENWTIFNTSLEVIDELSTLNNIVARKGLTPEWVTKFVAVATDLNRAGISKMPLLPPNYIIDSLYQWAEDLTSLKIVYWDFHAGNIMVRNNKYILVDLGFGRVPNTKIPKL